VSLHEGTSVRLASGKVFDQNVKGKPVGPLSHLFVRHHKLTIAVQFNFHLGRGEVIKSVSAAYSAPYGSSTLMPNVMTGVGYRNRRNAGWWRTTLNLNTAAMAYGNKAMATFLLTQLLPGKSRSMYLSLITERIVFRVKLLGIKYKFQFPLKYALWPNRNVLIVSVLTCYLAGSLNARGASKVTAIC